MLITSSTELRELTGSYYANNDFTKIKTDVQLQTEAIIRLVGQDVYNRALTQYVPSTDGVSPGTFKTGSTDDVDKELIQHLQLPIALKAAFQYFQSNLVSHDDTSRKVKIDKENESMAWEWMIDRDDAAHQSKIQKATDRLIAWLDRNNIDEWKASDERKAARKLFVPDTATFQEYYPIDYSGTFYHTARPLMAEVQRREIRQALGNDFQVLLDAFQAQDVPSDKEVLLGFVQQALVLHTVARMVRRLNIHILPEGVMQAFKSYNQTANASQVPLPEALRLYSLHLERDADLALDEIRKLRYQDQEEYNPTRLIPENKPCRKFART